jgi:hypothetical protein
METSPDQESVPAEAREFQVPKLKRIESHFNANNANGKLEISLIYDNGTNETEVIDVPDTGSNSYRRAFDAWADNKISSADTPFKVEKEFRVDIPSRTQ